MPFGAESQVYGMITPSLGSLKALTEQLLVIVPAC